MTIAQQTLKKHKIITTRGESEKKKKTNVSCACVPPEKIKNEKSVTTNKRIHPKKIVSIVIYFSFIHSMHVCSSYCLVSSCELSRYEEKSCFLDKI